MAQFEGERKIWEQIIKRKDRKLQKTDKVCSHHFLEKDYRTYDEFTINGKVVRLAKEKASLNAGAQPVVFDTYPLYYQPKIKERKPPAPRKNVSPKKNKNGKKSTTEESDVEANTETGDSTEVAVEREDLPPEQNVLPPPEPEQPAEKPEWSHENVQQLQLPVDWVLCNSLSTQEKVLVHIDPTKLQIDKIKLNSVTDAARLVITVDQMKVCSGTGLDEKPFSVVCNGYAPVNGKRCLHCKSEMHRLKKKNQRKILIKKKLSLKREKNKINKQTLKRSKARLLQKIAQYRKTIADNLHECRAKKKEVLEEAIKTLPPTQQEAVRACFKKATAKGPSGVRYTIEWIYECMLMKIKSPKLYDHIRRHQILALPCSSTIRGYLKHYSGAYGFQPSTFDMLKPKAAELLPEKRRGAILIDEVKLTPGVHFDQSALKVEGFVDFGTTDLQEFGEDLQESLREAVEKLPLDPSKENQKIKAREKRQEKNKNKRDRNLGDHALVITFQPFQGSWVQNLACFLTKGCANDMELTRLILECVILVESTGFMVDAVVTDGASWNRSMWKRFGVNEECPTSEHPCDETRRLHFISDFPHLLKCMRNCFVDKKVIETAEGSIKLEHWEAVVEADALREIGFKRCPRLTKEHLNPDSWAKMRCSMAWQFWSNSVAAGMLSYRWQDIEDDSKLHDCDPSAEFCKLVNNLADVMNSRTPKGALKLNSPETEVIEKFLDKLTEMQNLATKKRQDIERKAELARIEHLKKQNKKFRSKLNDIDTRREYVFSESTDVGLVVTLKGTLQLLKFLTQENIGYKFLMTSRLNQDALERFFGLMRQSCGPNTHPEPKVFAQLFRLLSIYSLVKPIKGSNITGGDMLHTLLNLEDIQSKTKAERKKEFEKKLDDIVNVGENLEQISVVADVLHDHSYIDESIDEFAMVYVAGYVARKSAKFTKSFNCEVCEKSLKLQNADQATDEHLLIKLKSRGYLTYPSDAVVCLIRHLEKHVLKISKSNELEENILFLVAEDLENSPGLNYVGCDVHKVDLTKSIIKFFLIIRMHFLCKSWNLKTKQVKSKQRNLRKQVHVS
ncbi:Transposable element P transposase [Frankliniella fusca]|uniref:Transposable element P transposase n=1 Tax=Frankliniella fusca TaxID=407009 RepID=A0AAE1LIZ1_9NEOP|nr:Transposable element P transposase [Frankliniella fusca]